MARTGRIVLPGYPHHIVQRGHSRQVVFAGEADYRRYLGHLHELSAKHEVRVHAYCLMTYSSAHTRGCGRHVGAADESAGGVYHAVSKRAGGQDRHAVGEPLPVPLERWHAPNRCAPPPTHLRGK